MAKEKIRAEKGKRKQGKGETRKQQSQSSRRFRFKSFTRQVEEAQVDVFRSLAPTQQQPSPGCSSFFQQALLHWRELSAAVDFNEVHSKVAPLVASLPQLVFHRHRLVAALLARLHMRAALSLQPILSLLATLPRDLQHDFLPFLPLCLDACLRLLQQGADRDAAALQQVVQCVGEMVKHLRHYLTPDVVTLLKMTKPLRFYPAGYVRDLIAQSVAFVLRNAPPKQMARGVRWLLAEARAVPCEERESGVALLLAHAAKGPAHSLHSKAAPLLLRLLLLPSSLRPPALVLQGERVPGAANVALTVVTHVVRLLAAHLLPATAGPLLSLLLTAASQAVQGGKGGAQAQDTDEQGGEGSGEERSGGKEGGLSGDGGRWEEARRLADVLHLVNAVLQHRRAVLVTHLAPFISLSLSLASHPLLLSALHSSPLPALPVPRQGSDQQQAVGDSEAGEEGAAGEAGGAGDAVDGRNAGGEEGGAGVQRGLVREVMRLVVGVMRRERRRRGGEEAEGLEGRGEEGVEGQVEVARAVARWEVLFECADAALVLWFVRQLVHLHAHLLPPFLPPIMRSLNRLAACHPAPVLRIFLDLAEKLPDCLAAATLRQGGRGGLQQAVRGLLEGEEGEWGRGGGEGEVKGSERQALVWAAVRCLKSLPVLTWQDNLILCQRIIADVSRQLGVCLDPEGASTGEGRQEVEGVRGEKGRASKRRKGQQGKGGVEEAVAAVSHPPVAACTDSPHGQQQLQQQQQGRRALEGVLAAALETHSWLLSSHCTPHLPLHLPLYLSAARHHCRSPPVLSAVALFLQAFPRAQVGDASESLPAFPPELSANHMPAMIEALQDNFCHPSREMRVSSLRIICHFAPLLVPVGGEGGEARGRGRGKRGAEQARGGAVAGAAGEVEACLVFHQVEALESAPYDLQTGRHAATALAALAAHATSARLPSQLLPAVTRCVVGLLHSKFAMMWQPAIGCLAALLAAHPAHAWPVVWRVLRSLQGSFLLDAAGALAEAGAGGKGEGGRRREGAGRGDEEEEGEGEGEQGEVGDGSEDGADVTALFLRSALPPPSGAPSSAVLSSLLRALRQAPAVAATRPAPCLSATTALTAAAAGADRASSRQQQGRATAGQQLAVLFLAFVGGADDSLCGSEGELPTAHNGHAEVKEAGEEGGGEEEGDDEEGVVVNTAMVRGKQWHVVLSDWLELLKRVELTAFGPKGTAVKHVIMERFLVHPDPLVQQLALDCVVAWREGCLPKYAAHLSAIVAFKSLKEKITTWDIGMADDDDTRDGEEEGRVAEVDRATLFPVLIRLLLPKLKKRSGQLAGKAAAGVQRTTVLAFLARLQPSELLPLFLLMLDPFRPAFHPAHGAGRGEGGGAGEEAGFLHLAVDLVRVFSRQQLQPYVLALLATAVRVVQCYAPLGHPEDAEGREGERAAVQMGKEKEGEGKQESNEKGEDQGSQEKEEEEEKEEEDEDEGEEDAEEVEAEEGQRADDAADKAVAAAADGNAGAGADADAEEDNAAAEEEEDDMEGDTIVTKSSSSPHVPHWARELRSLALRVLAAILAKFPDIAAHPSLPAPLRPWPLVLSALSPALAHLAPDNAASAEPSALLALLLALSRSPRLALLLAQHPLALPALSALLSAPSARLPVVGAAMGVIGHVVAWGVAEREEGEEGEDEGEVVLQWAQAGGELGGEMEGVRVAVGAAVEGHLAAILPHMQQFIARQGALFSKGAGRALKGTALAVVGRMAGMVSQPALAGQLAAALTPFLRQAAGGRRRVDEGTTAAVLAVLQNLAPLLSPSAAATCVRLFAPLLTHLQHRAARLALVHTLSALAAAHPSDSMRLLASLVSDLCAYDPARIDDYDYTRRLHAYTSMHCHLASTPSAAQLQQQAVARVGREGCVLLLSCAVRDMADDDMSLRHSAAHFLQSFVRFAAALAAHSPSPTAAGGTKKGRDGEAGGVLSGWEACELVQSALLRHIKKGLHSPVVVVRREWVLLLRDVALHMGATSPVAELRCLVREDDVEADFFHNLVHLQTHRRVRALAKFASLCPMANFSPAVLLEVFLPPLLRQLLEGRPDSESGVIDACIAALGAMAGCLPWAAFHSLLARLLALLPRGKEKGEQWWEESSGGKGRRGEEVSAAGQRAILRAICGVLEQVRRVGGGEEKSEGENEEEKGEREGEEGKEGEGDGGEGGAKDERGEESTAGKGGSSQVAVAGSSKEGREAAISGRMQEVLLKDIIPQLSKHLVAGEAGREEVNSHVALAITRTLLLLSPDAIRAHLPRLLQTVVNPLKARSQGTRDAARAALCQLAGALGPAYLGYVIGVLRSALTRGFERHVLGFTLHALLLHVATAHGATMPRGALDYCLGDCLAVAVEGLLGEVAEERDVEAVAAGVREKRQSRSMETVRIAASLVDVTRSSAVLLAPIRAALPASLDPRVKRHVQEMVRHMAIGLLANHHATAGDLLVLVHAVLWEGVRVEKAHGDAMRERKRLRAEEREGKGKGESKEGGEEGGGVEEEWGEEGGMEGKETEGKGGRGKRRRQKKGLGFEGVPNGHVVALLGLQLFLSLTSHDRLPASDAALMPRLNALVPPLALTLSSPHDAILAASFRALAFLLHRRLPSVATVAPRVATSAFKVVQQAGRAAAVAGGMVHSCLKLLAVLLDRCPEVRVSEQQVQALLGSAVFTDLELPSTRTTAFAVLRALLRRKVVVPELYDAMNRVQLLLLRSHTPSVRHLAAALLLAFLLDYPLGPARLEAHMSFLIVNLRYEHQAGREAVLGMMRAVIDGFPAVLVEAQADTFFLPLVTRLVSDESARVRQLVAAVLKALFVRVKPPTCARLLRFASAWLADPSPKLQQAAALVLGLAVESVGVAGEQRVMVATWMAAAQGIVRRAQGGEEGEGGVEGWKGVYACLVLAEKVVQRDGSHAHSSIMRPLWRLLPSLLLHRHLWVRAAACRLLGMYLSHAAAAAAGGGGGGGKAEGGEEGGLKVVVRALVERGEQDEGEEEEGEREQGRGQASVVPGLQVLLQPSFLVVLAGCLCRVLESNAADDRLAQQTVKSLVALAPLLPLLPCRAAAAGGTGEGKKGLVVEVEGCEIGGEGRERLKLGWQLLRVRRREGERGRGDGSGDEGEEEEEEEEEEEMGGEAEGGVEGVADERAEEPEEEEKSCAETDLLDFEEGNGVSDGDGDGGADIGGAGDGAIMLGEAVGEGSEGGAAEGSEGGAAEGSREAREGHEAEQWQQNEGERTDGEEGSGEEHAAVEGRPDGGHGSWSGAAAEGARHIALGAVIKAVARVAYKTPAALRCVAALASALGGPGLQPYLGDVMLPLFRLSQGAAGAVVPPEVQRVVGEVLEHVRHEVGPAAFISAFSAARDMARRRAAGRREAARVSVLVDPERHARRRASLAKKRGEYKKRKNQQHRRSKMR
ncbi:hypothetical protein CLOP_g20705 [Closterium sp. NIES-67]|nr:hypothetical protein CLOP_g20705 [Closterium sp. NIES-67]